MVIFNSHICSLPYRALELFNTARRLQIHVHQWKFWNQILACWQHKPFAPSSGKQGQPTRGRQVRSPGLPRCLSPGPLETRSRGSLQGDGKRARVDPPRTEAGRLRAVPPFPPTPDENSGLPASLSSNLGVHPLRFQFAPGQRTAKREVQEVAGPSPGRAWGTGNNLPGRTP